MVTEKNKESSIFSKKFYSISISGGDPRAEMTRSTDRKKG